MVIEVSYQAPADLQQGRSRRSKYFEVNDVPPRQTVVGRLRMLAVDFAILSRSRLGTKMSIPCVKPAI
jgi:hypothetical protein